MQTPKKINGKETTDVGLVTPASPETTIGGVPIETYEEAWVAGMAAEKVLELHNGKVERDELYAVDADTPSIVYREYSIDAEGRWRAQLRLVLPPPRNPPFDEKLVRAKGIAAAFIESFLREDRKGGLRFADGMEFSFDASDGFAVLESFVRLCSALYGCYTTRGLRAIVDDVGGDYVDITVNAEWRG